MSLKISRGNVLDAKADAIILTIDGAANGMEGNIARAFARKWPDVAVDFYIMDQNQYETIQSMARGMGW